MSSYDTTRQKYLPKSLKVLLIAESPPPAADIDSSRQFYRTDRIRRDDRLFVNTMRALYTGAAKATEHDLEEHKEKWLRRFQSDGWYMIEALEESQPHEITKPQRQQLIKQAIPKLIDRIQSLALPDTKIILIKSNVFEVAAEPLREAGLAVLNTELVDYPGHYNQSAYRTKLAHLIKEHQLTTPDDK